MTTPQTETHVGASGSHKVVEKEPEGLSLTIPKNWKKDLPIYLLVAYLGGDKLVGEYLKAPADIREIKEEIVSIRDELKSLGVQMQALTVSVTQSVGRASSSPTH